MGIFAYKAAITKTKSATTSAFFFSSSFPSPRSFFFSFPFVIVILEPLFDAFLFKWLQTLKKSVRYTMAYKH